MKPRILIAGIGNIFFQDDGFGVAVVQQLLRREWPTNVQIVDFGIRGMDLAFAVAAELELVILVDALRYGKRPGSLSLIEPDAAADEPFGELAAMNGHQLDVRAVLQSAASLAGRLPPVLLVGCEPADVEFSDVSSGAESMDWITLSQPVRAAVDRASRLVEQLVQAAIENRPPVPTNPLPSHPGLDENTQ